MKIVIVEDELLTRDLIKKICVCEFGHHVVAETSTASEAVTLITKLIPDVVILDLSLPGADGFEVIRQVPATLHAIQFLILSAHCEEYTAYRIEKARVRGFVDKGTNVVDSIGKALRALENREVYFSSMFQRTRATSIIDQSSFLKILSNQEMIVLSLVGRGLDDEEIGGILGITCRTVQTHRCNISHKLNLHDIKKLIIFSQQKGLASFPQYPACSIRLECSHSTRCFSDVLSQRGRALVDCQHGIRNIAIR